MADMIDLWDRRQERASPSDGNSLVVDVEGYEGPLDLLLALARTQKVDLTQISISVLAEQYLAFIDEARIAHLELAADYLVMAAWLAYLKSKLLLPASVDDTEESGEELAEILTFRLQQLTAMREAANRLMNQKRLGRDVFARGAPEAIKLIKKPRFSVTLYDLLTAYATQRQRQSVSCVEMGVRKVLSLQEARKTLQRLLDVNRQWTRLEDFLIEYSATSHQRASVLASSFSASLELVREGRLEICQATAFAPLYVRACYRNES